ncbi:hypothetical protein EXIGLDRAFT_729635 [Exidia glandulosa HHB12029]|uniref:Uncharacterized protein n=1 Tax=Exidia glandulosa HHB12029 TaxID=1314781 RepID=A0A165LH76_EXIGL|nr:hypothetical protein EXIGLDRAFT_729635 [Exidia glandulosa HHB12029]
MSASDTLLVVHNPYGYDPGAANLGMVFVCYWLDWILRPLGGRHRAIDCLYYKRMSYDGRIIAVLSPEIDWVKERDIILRCLGAHTWKAIVKPQFYQRRWEGSKSLVFEFNKAVFSGRRNHLEHFGYTGCYPAPAAIDSLARDDPKIPLRPAAMYPAAVECGIPSMNERLELPVPPKATPPAKAHQQDALHSDTKVKDEPADDKSFFARVKQELSEEKKVTVKNEPGVQVKREVRFADDVKPNVKLEQDDVKPRIKAEHDVKQESSAHASDDVHEEKTPLVKREDHRDERRRFKREDMSDDRRARDPRLAKRQRVERS